MAFLYILQIVSFALQKLSSFLVPLVCVFVPVLLLSYPRNHCKEQYHGVSYLYFLLGILYQLLYLSL